ncbi:proton-conducting transporter transmembrane domain-containing protein [Halomonas sp. 328]|uniref:proton-conducting transporter transmembrane domain-containing protein n=1 Tax=Halomonas sp. 328 TaxID=2776704 RepID=UPI0018A70432|nr:proton-conducting transporter membrane subunit [Halomonas sp. 328]MBF8224379.1 NADH-quinone oxidoreductase subunit N [Halomonas sp. 328]
MSLVAWWLPGALLLPLGLALAAFLGLAAPRTQVALALAGIVAGALGLLAGSSGLPLMLPVGGWAPPLGIAWWLDPPAAALLGMTALLMGLASLAQLADPESRDDRFLWSLWWLLWASLNALLLSRDLFNLYVVLELMSLAAVGLVARSKEDPGHRAALRYLLASLLGSLLYLLGVALLYGQTGHLDLVLLSEALTTTPASQLAAVTLTLGLAIKAALVPLHLWLPAAHSRARAPVSALLSGAVVAAALMVLWRLWLGPLARLDGSLRPALALLGATALIWGGLQAMLQRRLKLVIAWSTLSQSGYALLLPTLAGGSWHGPAARGAVLLLVAHGLAKGALFLAAGALYRAHGHDRLSGLAGGARHAPLAWGIIALAGLGLVGLPPGGGFVAKWWLLEASLASQRLGLAALLLLGTLLTAAWLWRLAELALRPIEPADTQAPTHSPCGVTLAAALTLALLAWVVGLVALAGLPASPLPRLTLADEARTLALAAMVIWPLALLAAWRWPLATASPRGLVPLLATAAAAHLLALLADDLLSFLVGVTLLSLAGWALVRLDGRLASRRAAAGYLAMMLLAELALLVGLVLAWQEAPSLRFDALAKAGLSPTTLAALTLGLALKAGLPGLHAWLPLAHPAAPPLASAVLSGLIVKVGVLGALRLLPGAEAAPPLAVALVALGLAGAGYGVLRGLLSASPKRLLAWSSVSQLGLMATLLGLLMQGVEAARPALLLLVATHALAKAALFTGAGIAGNASPASRRLVLAALLLPALTLAGLPPSGGLLLKQGLTESLVAGGLPGGLATLSGVGSALLMLRLFLLLHRQQNAPEPAPDAPWLLAGLAGLGALAALLPWWLAPAPMALPAEGLSVLLTLGLPWLLALALGAGLLAARPLHAWLRVTGVRQKVRQRARHQGLQRMARDWHRRLRRAEAWLMPWPAFGVSLGVVALLLAAASRI